MTYYHFVQAVEERVKEEVEDTVSVYIHTAEKNNGTIRKGIILRKHGINISPVIYLEEYFEKYKRGGSLEYIIADILRLYQEMCFHKPWKDRNIKDYEEVKGQIIYRLVNREANEKMLREMPFVPYLDLAIVFCVLLEVNQYGTATMPIYNGHLELWGVSEDDIFKQAEKNTCRLLPDEFQTMSAVLEELTLQKFTIPEEKEDCMFVLSNRIRSYGAATILYRGRLEAIGMYLKCNYYILPSSIHE
ncbi:MAG: DUF5688 family protein, partial [Lachnospiraceae bacterium]